jgi:Domain of unknown function (DUF4371)
LQFLDDNNVQAKSIILENAPQNLKLTSPDTQKEIVNAAAEETTKEIIIELGEENFCILIDESRDIVEFLFYSISSLPFKMLSVHRAKDVIDYVKNKQMKLLKLFKVVIFYQEEA